MRLIDADEIAMHKFLVSNQEYQLGWNDAIDAIIENEPTVDAVPARHGKFIGTEYDGYADGHPVYYEWKCSECGCIFEDDEPIYKYCPNCGARMDEE